MLFTILGIMRLPGIGYKSGLNPPKVTDEAYINFLMATPKVCSATEAARVQPEAVDPPAHDAFT